MVCESAFEAGMFESIYNFLTSSFTLSLLAIAALMLLVLWILKTVGATDTRNAKAIRFAESNSLNALGWFATCFVPLWGALLLADIWLLFKVFLQLNAKLAGEAGELRWYVLAFVGLLTALGGLLATPLAVIRVFTTERQTIAAEQGQITDRISKVIDQLGQNNLAVKTGAIYSLERIILDSSVDRDRMMKTLNAYLQYEQLDISDNVETNELPELRIDLQAALDVILRLQNE